jgi:hypothetical protein
MFAVVRQRRQAERRVERMVDAQVLKLHAALDGMSQGLVIFDVAERGDLPGPIAHDGAASGLELIERLELARRAYSAKFLTAVRFSLTNVDTALSGFRGNRLRILPRARRNGHRHRRPRRRRPGSRL